MYQILLILKGVRVAKQAPRMQEAHVWADSQDLSQALGEV